MENNTDKKKKRKQKKHASEVRKTTERTPISATIWHIAKPFLAVAIALALVIFAGKAVIDSAYDNYIAPVDAESEEMVEVKIESGSNLSKIAEQLEEQGIIKNAKVFKYYVDFSDMSSKLLAGTFELSPSMTFDEIISVLKRPTSVNSTMDIRFREGDTLEAMAKTTVDEGLFASDDEYIDYATTGEAFSHYDFVAEVIVANGKSELKRNYILEGYLFPDQYEVYTDTTPDVVIEKQLTRFNQIFNDEYRQRADELGMTVDQVVTLASIIEKEGVGEDMPKISAVFHNRLASDMPLQSDATVMYVLKENRLIVTSEDTAIDSPYNTYKYIGLPVGPICNPSQAALEAALYPDEEILNGNYLYFCLGDPSTGEVFYTKTLAEHTAVQQKYKDAWAEYDKKNQEAANE